MIKNSLALKKLFQSIKPVLVVEYLNTYSVTYLMVNVKYVL